MELSLFLVIFYSLYNHVNKLSGQLRKTSNVQPIQKTICRECKRTLPYL